MSVIDSWANRLPLLAERRPSGAVAVRSHDVYVRALFAAGEPGALYDPSDLSTLAQSSDGAGAVAAVGDPVGRMLDVSGRGNHAVQATAGVRPLLARAPRRGVRNMLVWSEQFDRASWIKTRLSVTPDAAVAPDGTMTADKLVEDTSNNSHFLRQGLTALAAGDVVCGSIYARPAERTFLVLVTSDSNNVFHTTWFNLSAGTIGTVAAGHSATMEPAPGGWWRCAVSVAQGTVNGGFNFYLGAAEVNGSSTYQGDGASGIYVWGGQLELGSQATAYQHVREIYNVSESGDEHVHGLYFDGATRWMQVAAMDLSAAGALTVAAAARLLNLVSSGSATIAMLANHNDTAAASWSLQAPESLTSRINFSSSGTPLAVRVAPISGLSAPQSTVLTGTADIAASYVRLRRNGAAGGENLLSQNSGNYANAALGIGRQSGTAQRFWAGIIYGLIIRGAASSAREIRIAEQWAARRAGVVLQ